MANEITHKLFMNTKIFLSRLTCHDGGRINVINCELPTDDFIPIFMVLLVGNNVYQTETF